jgi:glycosyltransferase involved in cell wall biosynthesis
MTLNQLDNPTFQKKEEPDLSVVICTRNRGSSLLQTVESIFCNEYPSFEVLVIDQSTNTETKEAIQPFLSDPRFRYIPTATKGTGLSRNIGLHSAKADIVIYTDDDCEVPNNWLKDLKNAFNINPRIAVLYCSVDPGPHNGNEGHIPAYHYKEDHLYNSFVGYYKSIGMGAGMVVRKSAVSQWGGFDDHMGPGSLFQCGEDHDIALRSLSHKWYVYEYAKQSVIHNGFRTFEEYRVVMARDMYGLGAAHAKHVKKLDARCIPIILYSILYRCIWQPITTSIKSRKLIGFRRIVFYLKGFVKGLQTPIDYSNIVYHLS